MMRVVWELAEEGKAVVGCGTETGPGFELRGCGEWREEFGGEGAEAGNVGGVDGFVEADVFYGGSDDGAADVGAGGAGDYIDVGCADDKVEGKVRRDGD